MSHRTTFEEEHVLDSLADLDISHDEGALDWHHGRDSGTFAGSYSPRISASTRQDSRPVWLSLFKAKHMHGPTSIRLNKLSSGHGSEDSRCPFRLFDCKRFLDQDDLLVHEFYADFLCAQRGADDQRTLDQMRGWASIPGHSWVAVSYDSTKRPDDDSQVSTFMTNPDGFPIRYDVLKLICDFAYTCLKVKYLWLDKLCVRQDSPMETFRWSLPGNMMRAFGCATKTFVLLNGLGRMPPSVQQSGSWGIVFGPAPDFVSSLRVFLELVFSRGLQETVILLNPGHLPPESKGLIVEDLTAAMLPFEGFLRYSAQTQDLPLGGDLRPQWVIPINTFRTLPPAQNEQGAQCDGRSHRSPAESLYALLSSRDQLHFRGSTPEIYMHRAEMLGSWEVAIWELVLSRKADSCGQFVYGLTWLLQDLCNASVHQRPDPGAIPSRMQIPTCDLISSVMESVKGSGGLFDTGDFKPYNPLVQCILAIIVDTFNKIQRPSQKLLDELRETGPWSIPLLPEWISWKDRQGGQDSSTPQPEMEPEESDFAPELAAYLELTTSGDSALNMDNIGSVLALRLIHFSQYQPIFFDIPNSETEGSQILSNRRGVRVPLKICIRRNDEWDAANMYDIQVQYIELEPRPRRDHLTSNRAQDYWTVKTYTCQRMGWETSAPSRSSSMKSRSLQSFQLTQWL